MTRSANSRSEAESRARRDEAEARSPGGLLPFPGARRRRVPAGRGKARRLLDGRIGEHLPGGIDAVCKKESIGPEGDGGTTRPGQAAKLVHVNGDGAGTGRKGRAVFRPNDGIARSQKRLQRFGGEGFARGKAGKCQDGGSEAAGHENGFSPATV